jgi:peptide subunit release factor 1 (eRF1)
LPPTTGHARLLCQQREAAMAMVEVRDHALWIKHIHGDDDLVSKLSQMPAGALIELVVEDLRGHWKKMDNGKDGRPTNGLRAIGSARDHWHALQDERGKLVQVAAA